MPEPRMNGSAYEAALWRIEALREALNDCRTCADVNSTIALANNALRIDNDNGASMKKKWRREQGW